MIGSTINGKYRIRRMIGSGGMGSVYEAEELRSGMRLAVKVLQVEGLVPKKAAGAVMRFEREAMVAGSLGSEHVARVLEAGTDNATGAPFMVMEHLIGEDAQSAFQRLGPLQPALALRIAGQTCQGLAEAHAAGVVHRDIKPANLFLAKDRAGRLAIKIVDFGVAKIAEDDGSGPSKALTRTGSVLGSPLYMSPEQARGSKQVDARADLWSLGIVLFQGLTGRTPHQDIDAFGELIIAICSKPPPSVQRYAQWVPPEVAALVDRALRIEPDERFPSAQAMLETIRAILPGELTITDDMLVPLDALTRMRAAPRYVPAPAPAPSESEGLGVTRPLATSERASQVETARFLLDDMLPPLPSSVTASSGARSAPSASAVTPWEPTVEGDTADVFPRSSRGTGPAAARSGAQSDAFSGSSVGLGSSGPRVGSRDEIPSLPEDAFRSGGANDIDHPTDGTATTRRPRRSDSAPSSTRAPLLTQLREPAFVIVAAIAVTILASALRPLAALGSPVPDFVLSAAKGLIIVGVIWAFVRVFLRTRDS